MSFDLPYKQKASVRRRCSLARAHRDASTAKSPCRKRRLCLKQCQGQSRGTPFILIAGSIKPGILRGQVSPGISAGRRVSHADPSSFGPALVENKQAGEAARQINGRPSLLSGSGNQEIARLWKFRAQAHISAFAGPSVRLEIMATGKHSQFQPAGNPQLGINVAEMALYRLLADR